MRLLQALGEDDFSLVEFYNNIPPYAILSHTWGADGDEVTFKDIYKKKGKGRDKPGYVKLKFCAAQAGKDGIQYFWVDTCCIDKSSSTELSEAINSMFKWYQNSSKCYVFLSDVSQNPGGRNPVSINKSRWFTRGWTLQELLAPNKVHFFNVQGRHLGDRVALLPSIVRATGIPASVLRGSVVSSRSVEERFSWAKDRDTKREEDGAYCLMGLFGVHMPLLYGEGKENAFRRLQKEITSREQSNQPETTGYVGEDEGRSPSSLSMPRIGDSIYVRVGPTWILSPIRDVDRDETASIGDNQTDSFIRDKPYTSSHATTLRQDRSLHTQQMLSTDDQTSMPNTNYDAFSYCTDPRTENGESGLSSPTHEFLYPHHEANGDYATGSDNNPGWSPTIYTAPNMYTPQPYGFDENYHNVYVNEDAPVPRLTFLSPYDVNKACTSHMTGEPPSTNNPYSTIATDPVLGYIANARENRIIAVHQRHFGRGKGISPSRIRRSNITSPKPVSGRVNAEPNSALWSRNLGT